MKEAAIEVTDRVFTKVISNEGLVEEPGLTIVDNHHQLILPGLIKRHCHPDKSKLGASWYPVVSAKSIVECVEAEIPYLDNLELSLTKRADHLIGLELPYGATAFRTRVDVEPMTDLRYFDKVQALDQAKPSAVEIVVFPRHGLLRSDSVELADQALVEGADFIGDVDPYSLDGGYKESLAETFRLVDKHGIGVNIRLRDRHEAGITTVREIIRLTKEYGLQDGIFISHAFGLNDFIGEERGEVYDALAVEKIHISSSMLITPDTIPPIMELLRHGVNVHLGCDSIYGCWPSYGDDSLQRKLVRLSELFNVEDQDTLTQLLGLVTDDIMTLDEQGQANWPQVGAEATYLLTEAECTVALVARQAPVEISMVKGTALYQK